MVFQAPGISRPPLTEHLVPELMTVFSTQRVILVAMAGQECEPRARVITLLPTLLGLGLNSGQLDDGAGRFGCSYLSSQSWQFRDIRLDLWSVVDFGGELWKT